MATCTCDVRRQRRLDRRQHLLDLRDGLDDVGAGQRIDDDADRRLAVVEAGIADVLVGVDHLGDVVQQHRRAVAVGDDEVLDSRAALLAWSLDMTSKRWSPWSM